MRREWKIRQEVSKEAVSALRLETNLSPLTVAICLQRGLKDANDIREFLFPKLEALKDPYSLKDMDRAVERMVRARDAGERLRIYGDYDVDGTTGAALLCWIFRDLSNGMPFDVRQPDRFKDGYGLNVGAVEEAAEAGVKILMTVDCGITSFAAAEKAKELGIDLIILDHHQLDPVKGVPEAYAVINPQRADCESGLKYLCGCGIAFYFARALRSKGRELKWWNVGEEPNLKQHLDLVVMATAADMVPLIGDNHILVRHGLDVLKNTKKPGVKALLTSANVKLEDISPSHLGFVIGPRINASGRMASASMALDLLTTIDDMQALNLAQQIEKINTERADTQNQIWDQVRKRVQEGIEQGRYKNAVVVADEGWHEGVVGIVASRVVETFRKPAAVIAIREDFGKGSVRSYGGKDVLEALRQSSHALLGFGGHRHAAGLTVPRDGIEALEKAFDQACGDLKDDPAQRVLWFEGECETSDLDLKTLREIESLGPFGPGNPDPVFILKATPRSHQIIKGRHLKVQLGALDAIWFGAAETNEYFDAGITEIEAQWAAIPEINRFRGVSKPSLRVKDWRKTE